LTRFPIGEVINVAAQVLPCALGLNSGLQLTGEMKNILTFELTIFYKIGTKVHV
jgi:hypothetical protein